MSDKIRGMMRILRRGHSNWSTFDRTRIQTVFALPVRTDKALNFHQLPLYSFNFGGQCTDDPFYQLVCLFSGVEIQLRLHRVGAWRVDVDRCGEAVVDRCVVVSFDRW
ncbi:hypothetical protein F2Q69_00044666 [Brassica cretica]|uniref:Uncharacterized protein n=1 Tax=Brassica cretica TaxID=69181 RepID=A0A8S9NGT3_BRACR|nr:hypothetical protein F2Q69_00044666 [Brassica cretica]